MPNRHTDALDRLFALDTFGIKLGLDNITRLCAALGHPERAFTSLHIAGTNGKGSVTAMVHAALSAAGIPAARFVSPHLVDLSERFVIGTTPVDADELARVAGDVLDCAETLRTSGELPVHPTFFEATTAIAFELFRRAGVKVAVIEVGLGGRFDSTNVISPPVGAITSIGFDHQQYLGDSLEAIAFEKAGIIKSGMTVITGPLAPQASLVVNAVAADRGARVIEAFAGVDVRRGEPRDGRAVLSVTTPDDQLGPVTLGLRGEHQIDNALVAIRVLESARAAGIAVDRRAIESGLADVSWPGRLEVIDLPGARVLLDGAHNPDGARALAAYLQRWHPERPALVLGVMHDKDVRGIVEALLPAVSSIITTAAGTPRAIPARELAARVSACDATAVVRAEPDPRTAVDYALESSTTVCVAGSIYLIGAVRDVLRTRAILR